MKKCVFIDYWNKWTNTWFDYAHCFHVDDNNVLYSVKDKCRLKDVAAEAFDTYDQIKEDTKEKYFNYPKLNTMLSVNTEDDDKTRRLSRYKRAAVIALVVLSIDCIELIDEEKYSTDPYLLKERLAFHMAMGSIIQSFDQDKVDKLIENYSNQPLFSYDDLGRDRGEKDDTFLQSVYKDMYFSRVYRNYNILTMANVFGLLTEKSSLLSELIPTKME